MRTGRLWTQTTGMGFKRVVDPAGLGVLDAHTRLLFRFSAPEELVASGFLVKDSRRMTPCNGIDLREIVENNLVCGLDRGRPVAHLGAPARAAVAAALPRSSPALALPPSSAARFCCCLAPCKASDQAPSAGVRAVAANAGATAARPPSAAYGRRSASSPIRV